MVVWLHNVFSFTMYFRQIKSKPTKTFLLNILFTLNCGSNTCLMKLHVVTAGLKPDRIQLSSIMLNLSELRLGNPFFSRLPLPVSKFQIVHDYELKFLQGDTLYQQTTSIHLFNILPFILSVSLVSRSSVELMALMMLTVAKANGILQRPSL